MPENNNYRQGEQDRRLAELENKFNILCQNYNEEIGGIKVDIAAIKTNQRLTLFFVFTSMAALIGLFFK